MDLFNDKSMEAAFRYARAQTAHYSKSFYLSSAMLPKERRWATYALYGFCRYADNIIDNPRNRSAQELIDEIDYMSNELVIAYHRWESEHPILKPFIWVAQKHGIPIEYPLDLLKGVKMDIQKNRYENFDELYLFCYRVAGVVGLMMTHVLGYKSKDAFFYAEKLGIAMQLTNILRDVQEDKNMNRIYLPMDELEAHGLVTKDVMNERMNGKMKKFMRFQIKRALQYYSEANQGIRLLNTETQFAIYAASRIYEGILKKIEARNYDPFKGRVYVKQGKKFLILLFEIIKTKINQLGELIFPSAYMAGMDDKGKA